MAQVLIRNVPDDVVETYKVKADIAGKSLEQVLRELLMAHAAFTPAERQERARAYLDSYPAPVPPLSKDEIREGLE